MLRLLLALVLALGVLPMPAMTCDQAMPVAGAHAMSGMDHPTPVPPPHDCIGCIGCIAVADWDGALIAPPAPVASPILTARVAAMPLLPGEAPTTPPPRIA